MGRKRRYVRDDGMMICKPLKDDKETWHAAHITEFYGVDSEPLDFWVDPATGDKFGRPSGYCKKHVRDRVTQGYTPKRMQWVTEDEEEVFNRDAIQLVKERAGKMGPPVVLTDDPNTAVAGWEE
jgi:hypothetical protein